MKLTGQNFIGFETSSKGVTSFEATNPKTQKPLSTSFSEATEEEVDLAVRKAENAFIDYKNKPREERATFLETMADEILRLGDDLIIRAMAETALPEARLKGERMRTVNQLKLFADVVREGSWVDARIDTAIPERQPIPKSDIRQMGIALGPVGIFGASNFPLAFSVAGGDTASALAAGCPVVVKGHPLHPGTSELVAKAVLEAAKKTEMPDGVFSLVQGASHEVGMSMVKHPHLSAIGFTGSFRGGKAIFDAANRREVPIPVFAEMGSSNPVFLLPGALAENGQSIATGLAKSINLGVGQFCTNPGLVIFNNSQDASAMLNQLGNLVMDSGLGTMLSEGIKDSYKSGVQKLNSEKGLTEVATSSGEAQGNLVKAHVFQTSGETFLKNPGLAEEVFGPSSISISTKNKDEMYELARKLDGHLTATIHGTENDLEENQELIEILQRKVGRLIFNGYPTGVEVCHSMVHGGPFPATTSSQSTSVGTGAIKRFVRPICFQDFPQERLPDELKDSNPLDIWRLVNGEWTK